MIENPIAVELEKYLISEFESKDLPDLSDPDQRILFATKLARNIVENIVVDLEDELNDEIDKLNDEIDKLNDEIGDLYHKIDSLQSG
jgi:hypothetical protein